MTFQASDQVTCDLSHLVGQGPFEADITLEDRSRVITSQWNTNCEFDAAIASVSCDGTMNAHGAGGLEGVHFHFEWGPG